MVKDIQSWNKNQISLLGITEVSIYPVSILENLRSLLAWKQNKEYCTLSIICTHFIDVSDLRPLSGTVHIVFVYMDFTWWRICRILCFLSKSRDFGLMHLSLRLYGVQELCWNWSLLAVGIQSSSTEVFIGPNFWTWSETDWERDPIQRGPKDSQTKFE